MSSCSEVMQRGHSHTHHSGLPVVTKEVRICSLQIRRPNNYEPDVCIMLGPPDADPTMDLTALDIVKTVVLDSPNKLFVGGLPCDWTEEQVGACHETAPPGLDERHHSNAATLDPGSALPSSARS